MAREIKIDEAQLNKEFDALLDKMYYQYHYFPTNIPNFNNPKYDSDARFYSALSDSMAKKGWGDSNGYCNGLPTVRVEGKIKNGSINAASETGAGISGGACVFFFVFGAVLIGMIIFALYNV